MGAGSPEGELPAAKPRLMNLGLRTGLVPPAQSWTFGCAGARTRARGWTTGQMRDGDEGCGMEMRDADCARKPLHPQPVCKTVLVATAAEPSRLGAARSPAHLRRFERACPPPAPPRSPRARTRLIIINPPLTLLLKLITL